ncbi:MAG: DeoR/GlpR transcriptional regulator [Clostridia bacterium]|nr:DeoR/GlpR transcriptional regulator [Clostridia bacterium]
MIQYERQQAILQYLEKQNPASVKEIAKTIFVSEASVRRDIAAMEARGMVTKIYGGVLLSQRKNAVIPLDIRDGEQAAAKDLIARKAAELVYDGATIYLDASSTVWRMMKYLKGYKDLKIVTNNLRIFSESEGIDGKIYCTGGAYDPKNRSFYGPEAIRFTESVSVDLFFFSSRGLSEDGEITDPAETETALRKAMLKRAAHSYCLCNSSKIGKRHLFTVCRKEDISGIFCDTKLPWEKD